MDDADEVLVDLIDVVDFVVLVLRWDDDLVDECDDVAETMDFLVVDV